MITLGVSLFLLLFLLGHTSSASTEHMAPRKAVYRCGAQRKTANLAKGFLLGHASSASTECMAPRKAVYRCGAQRKTANLAKRFPNYPYDTPI